MNKPSSQRPAPAAVTRLQTGPSAPHVTPSKFYVMRCCVEIWLRHAKVLKYHKITRRSDLGSPRRVAVFVCMRLAALVGPRRLCARLVFAYIDPAKQRTDRKSTRLNSSHVAISYAVFCLKKKN